MMHTATAPRIKPPKIEPPPRISRPGKGRPDPSFSGKFRCNCEGAHCGKRAIHESDRPVRKVRSQGRMIAGACLFGVSWNACEPINIPM
jgi:hypothetical protein